VASVPRLRPDLELLGGYHSPQVPAKVRLNTNESPYPPPERWKETLKVALDGIDFHRYPDRSAKALREAIGSMHGVGSERVFAAKGSNEVIQCLLLAYGGPGRCAATFEPTYLLHSHIARLTGTRVVSGLRGEDFGIDMAEVDRVLGESSPELVFLCSPNNPTGGAVDVDSLSRIVAKAEGLVVVDEAYGQFSKWSALDLPGHQPGVAVVRTFSKTWAMAACRLGYAVADEEVVAACESVALPYHLDAVAQAAGVAALGFVADMEARVGAIVEERARLEAALGCMEVDLWPSQANFVLFRPRHRDATEVWKGLLDRSVLVRNCDGWPHLDGCLRVTVGTPSDDDAFLDALAEVLG